MKLRHVFILLLICSHNVLPVQMKTGTALWQKDEIYLNAVELSISNKWILAGNQTLSAGLYLPVVLPFEKNAAIPGVKDGFTQQNTGAFTELEQQEFLWVMADFLEYRHPMFSFGWGRYEPSPDLFNQVISGNPFYLAHAPFLTKNIYGKWAGGEIINSSAYHSSMTMIRHHFDPWQMHSAYFLEEFEFTVTGVTDFNYAKSPVTAGGGLEIKTGGVRQLTWAMGFLASAGYYQVGTDTLPLEQSIYRATTGLWLSFWEYSLTTGAIVQNNFHPFGPYLSALYPGRKTLTQTSPEPTIPGVFLGFGPPEGETNGLFAQVEYYYTDMAVWSYRIWYAVTTQSVTFKPGIVKENSTSYTDFNRHHNNDTFISFCITADIISDLVQFDWQSYFNTYENNSSLKSHIVVFLKF